MAKVIEFLKSPLGSKILGFVLGAAVSGLSVWLSVDVKALICGG